MSNRKRRWLIAMLVVCVVMPLLVCGLAISTALNWLQHATNPTYQHVDSTRLGWPVGKSIDDHWDQEQLRYHGAMFVGPSAGMNTQESEGTMIRTAERDKVISVSLLRNEAGGAPDSITYMQLELCTLVQVNEGPILPEQGQPSIVCELNAEQARRVWFEGIPDSLVTEMLLRARAELWAPLPLTGQRILQERILIEPDPFLQVDDHGADERPTPDR